MALFGDNQCHAWINFNGSGTVSTRGDYNVNTLTDNGTGDYTISFNTNASNNNYAATCTTTGAHGSSQAVLSVETDHSTAFATGSIRVQLIKTSSSGAVDRTVCCVVVHGD